MRSDFLNLKKESSFEKKQKLIDSFLESISLEKDKVKNEILNLRCVQIEKFSDLIIENGYSKEKLIHPRNVNHFEKNAVIDSFQVIRHMPKMIEIKLNCSDGYVFVAKIQKEKLKSCALEYAINNLEECQKFIDSVNFKKKLKDSLANL